MGPADTQWPCVYTAWMMQYSNRKPHTPLPLPTRVRPLAVSLTSVARSCLDRCGCPTPAATPTEPPVARSSSIASAITDTACQSRAGGRSVGRTSNTHTRARRLRTWTAATGSKCNRRGPLGTYGNNARTVERWPRFCCSATTKPAGRSSRRRRTMKVSGVRRVVPF